VTGGKKKGLSIGAAMKQRMGSQEAQPAPEVEAVAPAPVPTPPPQPEPLDPLESFNTRLPRSLQRRLKVHSALEGTKIQDVVQHALEDYLTHHGKKES